ncbi:MAG: hypothetical protein A3D41_04270 [Candidatus Sungbacteria bacterium RIFCSPHIGHO2_02_FULL_41_12b]|nr:MAG: hypothetical protein A3D41_04270 [Candidatus Sungbacteria bacterium RIFCSPHIGHO2_02_FULL_41_12b]
MAKISGLAILFIIAIGLTACHTERRATEIKLTDGGTINCIGGIELNNADVTCYQERANPPGAETHSDMKIVITWKRISELRFRDN